MKRLYKKNNFGGLLFLIAFMLLFAGCKKDVVDNRAYEEVKIVGVKINGSLFLPEEDDQTVIVTLPSGRDLSRLNVELLVANGDLINFQNNSEVDCRKPIDISMQGYNGTQRDVTLKIQSPPSLSNFIIEGITVPEDHIHFSDGSLIVQVPEGTDITNLAVTLEFINGTLTNFQNGQVANYSAPMNITVLGIDGETNYSYEFIITTQEVGPAQIQSVIINGIESDSVVHASSTVIIPYISSLTNFADADISFEVGFGNKIDPTFVGTGLNLLSGNTTVKVTGTDGADVIFTIGRPMISADPILDMDYGDFKFGANDMAGVAFSGDKIVIANYSAVAPVVIGPNYYDLQGNQLGVLNKTGVVIAHSLRKLASDDAGRLLVAPLGITDDQQTIYKWDNVTATPVPYITYSHTTLGISGNPRTAGINISGDLNGEAKIVVGIARMSETYVWEVHGGTLNPTPKKLAIPYTAPSYYYSVEPMPIGMDGYIGAINGNDFSGISSLTSTMQADFQQSGIVTSDCKVKKYKDRVYLSYTAYVSGKGAFFRICDITDKSSASFQNPIFERIMSSDQPNVNGTMDSDMTVIEGKLHAVFACTNIGLQVYQLEK